jgi:hypothetical protein
VPFKTNPWVAPRPTSNPGEFTDAEWQELSQNDEKWEAWKKKDNDSYAVVLLAGSWRTGMGVHIRHLSLPSLMPL